MAACLYRLTKILQQIVSWEKSIQLYYNVFNRFRSLGLSLHNLTYS